MCVRLMLPGEVAAVTATWRQAYEGRQDAPAGLPAGGAVCFELELLGFEKEPNPHALAGPEKLERGARTKEQGNQLFKQVGVAAAAREGGAARQAGATSTGLPCVLPCPC